MILNPVTYPLIHDIMLHTTQNKVPAYLLAIDFEKAFDSVSHVFLQKVLVAFGFGPTFCKWMKIIYKNAQSCVFNGDVSTGYFSNPKGVRQGDPLSAYLFLLCIEILASAIRSDSANHGVPFDDK